MERGKKRGRKCFLFVCLFVWKMFFERSTEEPGKRKRGRRARGEEEEEGKKSKRGRRGRGEEEEEGKKRFPGIGLSEVCFPKPRRLSEKIGSSARKEGLGPFFRSDALYRDLVVCQKGASSFFLPLLGFFFPATTTAAPTTTTAR